MGLNLNFLFSNFIGNLNDKEKTIYKRGYLDYFIEQFFNLVITKRLFPNLISKISVSSNTDESVLSVKDDNELFGRLIDYHKPCFKKTKEVSAYIMIELLQYNSFGKISYASISQSKRRISLGNMMDNIEGEKYIGFIVVKINELNVFDLYIVNNHFKYPKIVRLTNEMPFLIFHHDFSYSIYPPYDCSYLVVDNTKTDGLKCKDYRVQVMYYSLND